MAFSSKFQLKTAISKTVPPLPNWRPSIRKRYLKSNGSGPMSDAFGKFTFSDCFDFQS